MTILSIIGAYVLGSIPFGLLFGWAARTDVRRHGSGNIGFTNVLRVCGWGWALPVLVLDAGKGVVAARLLPELYNGGAWTAVLCGVAVILGHNFPVWLRFRGGKGVATSAGVLGALVPVPFLVALLAWGGTVWATRYVSAGSVLAAVVIVIAHLVAAEAPFAAGTLPKTLLVLVLALLVLLRHRGNIRRLFTGTENRIAAAAPEAEPDDGAADAAEPVPTPEASHE